MTRFSLCCAVHYYAALRRGLSHEDALAVGYLFAKYYAILKNKNSHRKDNSQQQQNQKPKFVPIRATISAQFDFPTLEFGKVTVKYDPQTHVAFLKLGDTWIDGNAQLGKRELERVPEQILHLAEQIPTELCHDARRIFEFYARLRNQLQL
jgi:hypothetical protein